MPPAGLRLHDNLRHSFASLALGGGVQLDMIGQLLAHANRQTTLRYTHLIHGPGTVAVNKVAEAVTEALAIAPPSKEDAA